MLDFTQEETALLVADGYMPGWMMDIREGDLIAIAPVVRTNFADGSPVPPKTLTVARVIRSDASYTEYDHETHEERLVPHTVINFIGISLDNLPEHCAYGNTYPCFIKRGE